MWCMNDPAKSSPEASQVSAPALGAIKERTTPTALTLYEFKRIYRFVSDRYGSPTTSCLDYGCGSGYGANLLAERFGSVAAIDIDSHTIDECRRRFPAPNLAFSVFEPPAQPFPDDNFDCVFSFQVLEHIPLDEVGDYLRAIWAMVRPGGVAVITTPNQANYFGGHSGNPFHVKEYSAAELESIVREALPANAQLRIFGQEDVLSTRTRIRIRRTFRNHPLAVWAGRVVTSPIRLLEVSGAISTGSEGMLQESDIEAVVGGFYLELGKPKHEAR